MAQTSATVEELYCELADLFKRSDCDREVVLRRGRAGVWLSLQEPLDDATYLGDVEDDEYEYNWRLRAIKTRDLNRSYGLLNLLRDNGYRCFLPDDARRDDLGDHMVEGGEVLVVRGE